MKIILDDHVYGMRITLIVGQKHADKYMAKYGTRTEAHHNAEMNIFYRENELVIYLQEFEWRICDMTTLAHECFHAALRVLDYIGHNIGDIEGTEPTAYYFQWMYTELMKKLNKRIKP